MIILRPLKEFKLPIIAECITPDVFRNKKRDEIEEMKIWEGNKQKTVTDLFKVEEAKTDETAIMIHGDVNKVRRIGSRMTEGEITIKGNVGMHLGQEMRGGRITVHGSVESWAGSMMKGGQIDIYGDAGDYLGAPYRGSREGMSGGRITVHGNVRNEAGAHMKKGMIKIYGNAGQFTGFRMRNGTIYVQKDCAARTGACMVGGKIVVGGSITSILPTFTIESMKTKVKIEEGENVEEPLYVFIGDLVENGNGKLYVSKDKNPLLSHYEKLL